LELLDQIQKKHEKRTKTQWEKQKKYAQEKETLDQQKEEARIKQEQVKQQEKLNEAANKRFANLLASLNVKHT
jgi:hypothetical protein